MSRRAVSKLALVISAPIVIWAAASVFVVYRHFRMEDLFQVASSLSSSTATADAAVKALSTYKGAGATKLLLGIASSGQFFIDDRQVVAIRAIAARNDPDALAHLASLLQPQIDLDRRKAVAEALGHGVCNSRCVRAVLHYEERMWCGKDVQENALLGEDIPAVKLAIEKEHAALMASLGKTLADNEPTTLEELHKIYGLGSPVPSSFALHMVSSLQLHGACPLLQDSYRNLEDLTQTDTLQTSLRDLNCTGSSSP